MDCPGCKKPLLPNSLYCIECGAALDDSVIALAKAEKKQNEKIVFNDSSDLLKIAVFSLIFPGLAHAFFLSDFFYAAVFAFSFILFITGVIYFTGTFYIDMPLLAAAYFIYTYCLTHAFSIYRRKFNLLDDSNYRFSSILIRFLYVIVTSAVFLGGYSNYQYYYNYVVQIHTDVFSPVFENGERIVVNVSERSKLNIVRGDLLLFKLSGALYAGNNIYVRGEYFEKVIGLPGEKINFKTDGIYINGVNIGQKFYPLNSDAVKAFAGTEFINAGDEYFAFATGIINGRPVSVAARLKKADFIGRLYRVAWPLNKRRKISRAL